MATQQVGGDTEQPSDRTALVLVVPVATGPRLDEDLRGQVLRESCADPTRQEAIDARRPARCRASRTRRRRCPARLQSGVALCAVHLACAPVGPPGRLGTFVFVVRRIMSRIAPSKGEHESSGVDGGRNHGNSGCRGSQSPHRARQGSAPQASKAGELDRPGRAGRFPIICFGTMSVRHCRPTASVNMAHFYFPPQPAWFP